MPEFTTDDGVRLHYHTRGDGPVAILYLHGMAADGAIWSELWDLMDPRRYLHVALDLRGHGLSTCAPCEMNNERLSRDVLAIADHLGLDRFVVLGMSMGGKIGIKLAAMAPDRVAALVTLGTPGPGLVPFKREEVAEFLSTYHDLTVTRAFFEGWFKQTGPKVDSWLKAFSQYPDWLLRATAEMAVWTDFTAEITGIATPVLVIAGADDPVYGPAYQRSDVLRFLPHARMVAIEDCGHGLILERPAEIAAEVDRFIRGMG